MKTTLSIIIGIIVVGMIFSFLLYIPAYSKCQSFGGDLTNLDTCVLRENKWITCYDVDPVDNTCIIDGMKIKDAENEN